jgi:hypothetical protein
MTAQFPDWSGKTPIFHHGDLKDSVPLKLYGDSRVLIGSLEIFYYNMQYGNEWKKLN